MSLLVTCFILVTLLHAPRFPMCRDVHLKQFCAEILCMKNYNLWKPALRTKFLSDSSSFYHIFLFVLNCSFRMFIGSCFTILNMLRKSLKNARHYFSHMGFWYLFFQSSNFYVVTLTKIDNQKIQNIFVMSLNET